MFRIVLSLAVGLWLASAADARWRSRTRTCTETSVTCQGGSYAMQSTTVTKTVGATAGQVGQLLAAHNQARGARGLPPLALCLDLCAGAEQAAAVQAARGQCGHPLPLNGASAENAAAGHHDGADATRGWLQSPGHASNLLSRQFTHVGFGVAYGRNETAYYTARFR